MLRAVNAFSVTRDPWLAAVAKNISISKAQISSGWFLFKASVAESHYSALGYHSK
jgi:hypothetical protein